MSKEVITIKAQSQEMAEKLARGVWAVCPDAEIKLSYPKPWLFTCQITSWVGKTFSVQISNAMPKCFTEYSSPEKIYPAYSQVPEPPAERKATTHHQVGFCSMPATEEQNVLSMLKTMLLQPRLKRSQKPYRRRGLEMHPGTR